MQKIPPQKVLCTGRVYCDLIFTDLPAMPVLGQEMFAGGLNLHAGGGCYITAAYLSAFGCPVAVTAMLPAEPFSTIIRDEMAQMQLDDRFCDTPPKGDDPQITVSMVTDNERAFLTRRPGSALPADMTACFAIPGLTHLHIGELTTLIEHPDLLEKARAAGMTISLDCGWDEDAFCHPDVPDLIAAVDIFFPNSAEADRLLQRGISTDCAPNTVVKRGAEGARFYTADQHYSAAAPRNVTVIDTTGAGDAFNAGFLMAWLQQQSPEACLAAGNHAGSIAVGRVGGAAGLAPGMFQPTMPTI
jgi:sugar/nucleoside kinase (ribokinase family)